ncbi:MAG: propanediol utilization protein [Pseudorhodobacter sp.]
MTAENGGQGMARVAGHFGELMQGRMGPGGPVALITLPCPALYCQVIHRPGSLGLFEPDGAIIGRVALRRLLADLGLPATGRFVLRRKMIPGGGAGASTAARVALLHAAGATDPARVARACLKSEGASDPLMFENPGRILWASREARILSGLPPLPRMEVVGGFWGPAHRTDPRDLAFPDIADLVAGWQGGPHHLDHLAGLASQSAERMMALRGKRDDPTAALARCFGAKGWVMAHTGSARGLIFAPGAVPADLITALRAAGFCGITRFGCGG